MTAPSEDVGLWKPNLIDIKAANEIARMAADLPALPGHKRSAQGLLQDALAIARLGST